MSQVTADSVSLVNYNEGRRQSYIRKPLRRETENQSLVNWREEIFSNKEGKNASSFIIKSISRFACLDSSSFISVSFSFPIIGSRSSPYQTSTYIYTNLHESKERRESEKQDNQMKVHVSLLSQRGHGSRHFTYIEVSSVATIYTTSQVVKQERIRWDVWSSWCQKEVKFKWCDGVDWTRRKTDLMEETRERRMSRRNTRKWKTPNSPGVWYTWDTFWASYTSYLDWLDKRDRKIFQSIFPVYFTSYLHSLLNRLTGNRHPSSLSLFTRLDWWWQRHSNLRSKSHFSIAAWLPGSRQETG